MFPSTPSPRRRARLTLILSLLGPASAGADASVIYFADIFVPDFSDGSIRRINDDGTALETLRFTGGGLRSVDADLAAGKLYWCDVDNFVIRRSNLDGSGVEDLVTSGLVFPSAIAVDAAGGKMYWGDQVSEELLRANLDGSEIEPLRSTAFHRGIAVDPVNGHVYWTTSASALKGDIRRCNLDGSAPQTIVTSTATEFKPASVALDIAGGKIYWSDYVVDVVRRANLDGTDVEELFSAGGNFNPRGVALDLDAGKVYWGQDIDFEGTQGKIMRMNLDGSLPQNVATGLGLVNDLVILPGAGCPADLDGDGDVDLVDVSILVSNFGLPGDPGDGDIDGNGIVDIADLALLLSAYGAPCA